MTDASSHQLTSFQRERSRQVQKAWRERNPDRVRQLQKAWRERNPDRVRKIASDHYKRNADEIKSRYRKNPQKTIARTLQWREDNPEKWAEAHRKQSRRTYQRKRDHGQTFLAIDTTTTTMRPENIQKPQRENPAQPKANK